jgi:hypothetical protein
MDGGVLRICQRRRREIFVEYQPQRKSKLRRSGIFGKSFLAGFENVSRVVFHAELFQQLDVFLPE